MTHSTRISESVPFHTFQNRHGGALLACTRVIVSLTSFRRFPICSLQVQFRGRSVVRVVKKKKQIFLRDKYT